MKTDHERFFVLTGGPGAGKSTLVAALAQAGYAVSEEAGRGVIQDQARIDGPATPWRDPALFAELMLCWEMRSHRMAQREDGVVFFDRGAPDLIGYLRLSGLTPPAHVQAAARELGYNSRVFIAPPWPEIYARDAERRQDLAEAERTYQVMAETYSSLGYDLVELPRAPVEERLAFVTARIGSGG